MSNWQDIGIALVTALTGATGIKLIEAWLGRSKAKSEQDKMFRDELRTEAANLRIQLDALRAELKETEKELDGWKEKYWDIYMQYRTFKIEVQNILIQNGLSPDLFLRKDDGTPT